MLVYGDAVRTADPRHVIAALKARLEVVDAPGSPVERHARLSALFIAGGELAQGLADAAMAARGGDGPTPEQDTAVVLVQHLAAALLASWRALGDQAPGPLLDALAIRTALDALDGLPLPAEASLKTAEGYAFYALYPEAYADAAEQLGGGREVTVIGVRSIGLGLAAVVASVMDTGPPVSVRPVGHPFERRLQLLPALETALTSRIGGRFVVVDEGPGLSGSSFGAVADALEAMGAARSDIAFLPGHGGDLGPQASPAHRARWRAAERPCTPFDPMAPERPGWRLASWFPELTDGGEARLQDLSGGAWRALRYAGEAEWPAANTGQERRKLLLTTPRGGWLLKFAGLGETGERAFARAHALASAGFAPEATALRYGFLAQPWLEHARPLDLQPRDRPAFAAHLGRYLGWRAAELPAPTGAGAGLDVLLQMARVNATEALGGGVARSPALADALWAGAPPLARVWTDNRLHAQEWLELGPRRWLKTDAVDHACAHDLIGAQDIAWDVAAAWVEFDLDAGEMAILLAALGTRATVEPALVSLLEPAYLAFQLGAFTMAAAAHAGWPQEQARLARAAANYRARLQILLL